VAPDGRDLTASSRTSRSVFETSSVVELLDSIALARDGLVDKEADPDQRLAAIDAMNQGSSATAVA